MEISGMQSWEFHEEFLEHMEFQPIKGKPTFDIDNTSKVKTVETVEAS